MTSVFEFNTLILNEGNILSTKFSRRKRRFRRFAINTHYFVIIYPYPHAKICAICVICERFHTPYPYSRRVRSPILATAVPDMAGQTWKYLFNYSIGGVQLTRFLELSLREF